MLRYAGVRKFAGCRARQRHPAASCYRSAEVSDGSFYSFQMSGEGRTATDADQAARVRTPQPLTGQERSFDHLVGQCENRRQDDEAQ